MNVIGWLPPKAKLMICRPSQQRGAGNLVKKRKNTTQKVDTISPQVQTFELWHELTADQGSVPEGQIGTQNGWKAHAAVHGLPQLYCMTSEVYKD